MATLPSSFRFLLVSTLALLVFLNAVSSSSAFRGGKVGGRTEVKDVKTNKEVQSLGRFSVEEHNNLRGSDLSFSEVVEAQRQVVSGVKYYLKVSVKDSSGADRDFDAVVFVKPWLESKKLLSFTPSVN